MIHFSSIFAYSIQDSIKATWELIKLKFTNKGYTDITADALLKRLTNNEAITVIDCRRASVFTDIGHIEGALNHPAMTFEPHELTIPKGNTIAVVCYFGYFCQIASQKLAEAGYTNVLSMKGGMEDWIMSGKPITKG